MSEPRDRAAGGRGSSGPRRIDAILSRTLAERGLGQVTARLELECSWQRVAGPKLAARTRVGALRRGELEILVDNAPLLCELEGYHKDALLVRMKEEVRHSRIRALRFRRS